MKRLILLILITPYVLLAQHTIKGTFSPAGEFNMALLYKVTPTMSNYITNSPIDEHGNFNIKLDSTVTKGTYRITYAVPQEEYNFDVIYNGEEDIELTFNSETGVKFLSSVENKLLESYTNSMLMITQSIGNYYRDSSDKKSKKSLEKIFKTQLETQQGFEKAAKGTIAYHFIKANKPYIPESAVDVLTYVDLVKTHYFDNVDFNSKILQSSNFLTERMLNYVFGISTEKGNEIGSYKKSIANFNKKINQVFMVPAVKKALFTDLWEHMVDIKLDPVANFIAEEYLMDLCVNLNDQQLLHALILYKNISVGNVAPDFLIEIKEKEKTVKKRLTALDIAENYIIVFWSSTCSHCLNEVPKLYKFTTENFKQEQLKVIAVGLEDEPYKWKDLTYSYPEFIHVYGEGKWDNEIGDSYGVSSTPTYFVLNKNKEIIAKPYDYEGLIKILEEKKKERKE